MSKPAPGTGSIKEIEQKKREVFKPLLENPFSKGAEWPPIERSVSETIMQCLTQSLSSYGSYLEMKSSTKSKDIPSPELAAKITIGFNSTVKKLEDQAKPNRAKLLGKNMKKKSTTDPDLAPQRYVKYVFVAKADISTSLLTSCFPLLTFSASKSTSDRVKLIELPRGAMGKLSGVLKTPNVGVFSIEESWSEGKMLFDVINSNVRDVEVPWLAGLFENNLRAEYEKPNIKFVRTTIPIGKGAKRKKGILKKKKNRKGEKKIDPKSLV